MKWTRDSAVWWALLAVAVSGFLGTHFELITKAFPLVTPVWQSRLELVSGFGVFVAAYLRMSPLALSHDSELAGQGADPSKSLSITGKEPPKE